MRHFVETTELVVLLNFGDLLTVGFVRGQRSKVHIFTMGFPIEDVGEYRSSY